LFLGGGMDTVVLRSGDGTDTIFGYELGKTTLGLSDGLERSDLTFAQGAQYGLVFKGGQLLARVADVSASALESEGQFSML